MFVLFARIRFLEGHKIYQRSGIGTHGIALGFLFDYNKSEMEEAKNYGECV